MVKNLKAVRPYARLGYDHFKMQAFAAWQEAGGAIAPSHYPPRWLHKLCYAWSLPTFSQTSEARLRFVEPVSICFDTFPDVAFHETVPMVWDCWPMYFERVAHWFSAYHVRTAIFTSSQTAERMQHRFPDMNILFVPEGIRTSLYKAGKSLAERSIDLFEIGSVRRSWYKRRHAEAYGRLCRLPADADLTTNEGFRHVLQETRLTVVVPRCLTQPEETGDIETLTQRYWEAMLSGIVMVGKSPRELTDLLGYDPVISLDKERPTQQIEDILAHIADYQQLADRNREAALRLGDWTLRMRQIQEFLTAKGYEVKKERTAQWKK